MGIVTERNRGKKEGVNKSEKYPENILKKYGQKGTKNLNIVITLFHVCILIRANETRTYPKQEHTQKTKTLKRQIHSTQYTRKK